jgi:REP-associated tyrosine transposase
LWIWFPIAPLSQITNGVKGVSARDANRILGRVGKKFWQDESFDHWVRNAKQFDRIRAYIEWNPVAAGLVRRPEDWRWSSARKQGCSS